MNVWKSTSNKGKKCEKHYWKLDLFDEDGVKHKLKLSRLVAKTWIPNPNEKIFVDHISGDTLDDSLENLRWATSNENCHNRTVNRNNISTGIKNISLRSNGTYRVRVMSDGKTYGKTVKSIEEAIELAKTLREKYHGDFDHE